MPSRFLSPALAGLVLACSAVSSRADWSWVWAADSEAPRATLRKQFELSGNVRDATLVMVVDNAGRASLNGAPVLTNSSWSDPSRAVVTSKVRAGTNVLEVDGTNEGGIAGLAARLLVRYADGRQQVVVTDETWEVKGADGTWQKANITGKYGAQPWGDPLANADRPLVAQPADIQVLPGFRIELQHVVPKDQEGSWVSMTFDPQGRMLACDQHGSLYRLTPSPIGSSTPAAVERLDTKVGGAHGLLYAFNSLYVMVNEQSGRQGLWRLQDLNGDGQFEQETLLRRLEGGGEHGPHAIVLSPDGKSLYLVAGNHTKLPENMEISRAPKRWDEDQTIPRMWDANGHARGILAPGGYICKTDPEARKVELISYGYRNQYDMAFNAYGDIVTYDSDMEWDAGTPWYRPTRINLATSGSDMGWRSGSGKWPTYYPDSLPALLDIGPGSPTGVESGRGAKFPARYQHAVYAADWTYGTLYAVHLTPQGGAYRAEAEEFLSGKPLPLTDLEVSPKDGALYFAIGGRKTQSAVYRVVYTGTDSTAPAADPQPTEELKLRWELEKLHEDGTGPAAVDRAWPHLGHPDRWIRYAARIAVERQPISGWLNRALAEPDARRAIEAGIAVARMGSSEARDGLLDRLHRIDFAALDEDSRLALLRAYQLAVIRLGAPEGESRARTLKRLDALFPARSFALNRELSYLLIALESPSAVAKTLQLMSTARDEEINYASDALLARNAGYADAFNKAANSRPNLQQIAYAYALRTAKVGWTPALRRTYFAWFPRTAPWQGGNSFRGFLNNFRSEALANVTDAEERKALEALSDPAKVQVAVPDFAPPKGPGQDYTVDEVLAFATRLEGRDYEDGRRLYHSAACFSCHPFAGSGGGVGPDLTGSGSRYTLRDLLENIIEPSKVISDQYGSEEIELTDGSTLVGRAYEENGRIHVVSDPRNPTEKESAELTRVKSRRPYPVSLMPSGLLNGMNQDEVLNLLAYLQAGGNPSHPAFKKP